MVTRFALFFTHNENEIWRGFFVEHGKYWCRQKMIVKRLHSREYGKLNRYTHESEGKRVSHKSG